MVRVDLELDYTRLDSKTRELEIFKLANSVLSSNSKLVKTRTWFQVSCPWACSVNAWWSLAWTRGARGLAVLPEVVALDAWWACEVVDAWCATCSLKWPLSAWWALSVAWIRVMESWRWRLEREACNLLLVWFCLGLSYVFHSFFIMDG